MFTPPSLERMQEVLHSPFDITTHKDTFIDYLELVIKPDGTAEYAMPSHMMKLADIYGKPAEDVYEEYLLARTGLDGIDYLCLRTGCIAVWNNRVQGVPNAEQEATLLELQKAGLYSGLLRPLFPPPITTLPDVPVSPDR